MRFGIMRSGSGTRLQGFYPSKMMQYLEGDSELMTQLLFYPSATQGGTDPLITFFSEMHRESFKISKFRGGKRIVLGE